MTNGEKIVQLFPNAQVDQGETRIYVWLDHSSTTFDREWWNAEYKEPNCSEIPTGSTTKNCRSCRNFGSHHGICEICKDNKCWTEKEPIERYHSRNLKAYADDMGVSVEQAEKELLREEPTTKNDVSENNAGNIYICSCGYGWDKSKVVRYHFCPNCGKAVASATKNDLAIDCISRIETIDYLCKHCPDDGECFKDCDEIKHLRQMSSVTPQPRKGHWIVIDDCELFMAKCSECGELVDSRMISKYPYCHCGAQMIEPQESEDKG